MADDWHQWTDSAAAGASKGIMATALLAVGLTNTDKTAQVPVYCQFLIGKLSGLMQMHGRPVSWCSWGLQVPSWVLSALDPAVPLAFLDTDGIRPSSAAEDSLAPGGGVINTGEP